MLNRRSFFSRIAAAVIGAPLVAKILPKATPKLATPELVPRYADLYVRNQQAAKKRTRNTFMTPSEYGKETCEIFRKNLRLVANNGDIS